VTPGALPASYYNAYGPWTGGNMPFYGGQPVPSNMANPYAVAQGNAGPMGAGVALPYVQAMLARGNSMFGAMPQSMAQAMLPYTGYSSLVNPSGGVLPPQATQTPGGGAGRTAPPTKPPGTTTPTTPPGTTAPGGGTTSPPYTGGYSYPQYGTQAQWNPAYGWSTPQNQNMNQGFMGGHSEQAAGFMPQQGQQQPQQGQQQQQNGNKQ